MKTFILNILLFFFSTSTFIYAQSTTQKTPLAYLENISTQLRPIQDDSWQYISSVAHSKSAKKIENRRKELVASIFSAKKNITVLKGYNGNTALRDSVLNYLKINLLVINEEYAKIVDMEAIAEQSYDNMEAYLTAQKLSSEKLDKAGNKMEEEVQKFAAENGITLLDSNKDKVGKSLEKASDVIDYYNKVYLIFFKAMKQEAYLVDAFNKNDINAYEQNKSALLSTVKECSTKLDSVKAYKADNSLKLSLKKVLEFYEDVANNIANTTSDLFMKKEKFERLKKSFDAKAPAKRTQQDIDAYNNAVNEFNAASNDFNVKNNLVNKKRVDVLDAWQKSVQTFMSKNIPKYSK